MIICVCKGVNEQTIREKCDRDCSYRDIQSRTNAGTVCGICLPYIEQMLKEHDETKIR